MDPAIVCLEKPQRKAVVKKRQVIVHAAAGRQGWSPLIRIVINGVLRVRPTKPSSTHQPMGEERKVLHRGAENWSRRNTVETIILAVRMHGPDNLAAGILVHVIRPTANATHINRGIGDS